MKDTLIMCENIEEHMKEIEKTFTLLRDGMPTTTHFLKNFTDFAPLSISCDIFLADKLEWQVKSLLDDLKDIKNELNNAK